MWQTARLTIRRFRHEDWEDLHALQGDPAATQFIGGAWPADKTREVTGLIVDAYDSKPLEWFAVADRKTDRVLGACWLGQLDSKWCDALGWHTPQIELGYRYARRHWNNGYATEAGRAMLGRGFHELGLTSVVAIVDVRNTASERVLQKLGMTHVADATLDDVTIRAYRVEREAYSVAAGG